METELYFCYMSLVCCLLFLLLYFRQFSLADYFEIGQDIPGYNYFVSTNFRPALLSAKSATSTDLSLHDQIGALKPAFL